MQTKIALPKGRLLRRTSALLKEAEWGLDEYHGKTNFYHPKSQKFPDLMIKIFHEKDIPVQVAVGNYDLGICGLDWIEELLAKYPSSSLVKVKNLGYGWGALCMTISPSQAGFNAETINTSPDLIRIASEYPHLAESFAMKHRLNRFSIFPVWGGAEAYPPESAEMVLVSAKTETDMINSGMLPVRRVLDFSAFLIANKHSWELKNLNNVVTSICNNLPAVEKPPMKAGKARKPAVSENNLKHEDEHTVRLALPDGHQQEPTRQLLDRAGIQIDDYPSEAGNRRPTTSVENVSIKVIRPQDMPLQVANGNFDLAVTGRDWLNEHLYQFPSSPVRELADLNFGKVRLVAVVSQQLAVDDVTGLRQIVREWPAPLRVASEYVNIADKYARDNHLGRYRVIPTWGATEAFLPEDADLLIENTETGRTIARHNLKIIDDLFQSTACLIGSSGNGDSPEKMERIRSITETLRLAAEEA